MLLNTGGAPCTTVTNLGTAA